MRASYTIGHFWARAFGWLLLVKDTRKWPLLFSQRSRKYASIQLGWLFIELKADALHRPQPPQ